MNMKQWFSDTGQQAAEGSDPREKKQTNEASPPVAQTFDWRQFPGHRAEEEPKQIPTCRVEGSETAVQGDPGSWDAYQREGDCTGQGHEKTMHEVPGLG